MSFQLNKTSNLIIYGAGTRAYECYRYLIGKNFNVRFIVDKEPDNVEKKFKCPVVRLCDVPWEKLCNPILFICLQNGLLHDEIADELYKIGINQIIFLPTSKKYLHDDAMLYCYRKLLEQDWNVDISIPNYDEMLIKNSTPYIINDDGAMITCWATMEYIFSSSQLCDKELEIFFNKHISCLEPYLTLFGYFNGEECYPYDYLRIFRGNDNIEQERLLRDRVKLWNVYEEKNNIDPLYFIYAAPFAIWSEEKKHFKIIDGHHRAAYLFSKGWYNIPIRISKQDYDKYIEYHQMQLWNSLQRENCVVLFKICVRLLKWVTSMNIFLSNIYEQENTKGYITWWLKSNDVYNEQEENVDYNGYTLWICFNNDEGFLNLIDKTGWIITSQSISEKYKFSKCIELYSGFIGDRREVISLYEV